MSLIWLRYFYRTMSEIAKGGEELDQVGGSEKEVHNEGTDNQ